MTLLATEVVVGSASLPATNGKSASSLVSGCSAGGSPCSAGSVAFPSPADSCNGHRSDHRHHHDDASSGPTTGGSRFDSRPPEDYFPSSPPSATSSRHHRRTSSLSTTDAGNAVTDEGAAMKMPARLVASALQYLGWRDAARAREVCRGWAAAVALNGVVFKSIEPGVPAVFIRCPQEIFDAEATATEDRLRAPDSLCAWLCPSCGYRNGDLRVRCGNRRCQQPVESHKDCVRVFVGQLRREATVGFARWLVENVFSCEGATFRDRPSLMFVSGDRRHPAQGCGDQHGTSQHITLTTVDDHRHPTTHRGKGCAWLYLRCPPTSGNAAAPVPEQDGNAAAATMMQHLMSFHHRVFLDVEEDADDADPPPLVGKVGAASNGSSTTTSDAPSTRRPREGVWMVHPEHVAALTTFVSQRAYTAGRSQLLPRGSLVVELPGRHATPLASKTCDLHPAAPKATKPRSVLTDGGGPVPQDDAGVPVKVDDTCASPPCADEPKPQPPTKKRGAKKKHHAAAGALIPVPRPADVAAPSSTNTTAAPFAMVRSYAHDPYAAEVLLPMGADGVVGYPPQFAAAPHYYWQAPPDYRQDGGGYRTQVPWGPPAYGDMPANGFASGNAVYGGAPLPRRPLRWGGAGSFRPPPVAMGWGMPAARSSAAPPRR